MKKVIFSAAAFGMVAVSGMTLAPTTSEAIPAFARQTGAACFSCHFQEVPALKAFGRAFKMNSFTDVGDQALVEDDNLSIPAVLNLSFVVRGDMTNTKVSGSPTAANNGSTTVYNIPVDQNLLLAGRVGSNTGVFLEFGGGTGDTQAGGLNNMQVMNSFDAGGFKVGIGYADTSFGADAVLSVNSVYGQHAGAAGGFGTNVSAVQNSGFTNSITSIGAWVGNDMGFIQFALVAPGGSAGWTVGGAADAGLTATGDNAGTQFNVGLKLAKLVKVAVTLDVGGFDTIIGAGTVGGKVGKKSLGVTNTMVAPYMDMQWVYGQMQGEIGDMSLGVYADWAHAKGKSSGNILGAQDAFNTYDVGTALVGAPQAYNALLTGDKFDAYSIRATLEPVERLTVGLGYGYRKTSGTVATVATSMKHSVFSLGVGYSIYQNMIVSLSYTSDKATDTNVTVAGKSSSIKTKTTVLDYVIYM